MITTETFTSISTTNSTVNSTVNSNTNSTAILNNNAMVIVEPREHKLLEAVIKNFDDIMDSSWDLYVFHGKSFSKHAH
jgi:hypothetical protein